MYCNQLFIFAALVGVALVNGRPCKPVTQNQTIPTDNQISSLGGGSIHPNIPVVNQGTSSSTTSSGLPLSTNPVTTPGSQAVPNPVSNLTSTTTNTVGTSWSGLQGVQFLFSFGDSYTGTEFDPTGAQPAPGNQMGNPAYPGGTTSDGPNWIDYLTVANKFLTYNFAYGGATVDSAIVQPFTSTVKSMKEQVEQEYIPIYGSHPASAPWTASNSLFSFWIGINDVDSTFSSGQFDTIRPKIIAAYQALLLEVYNSGARNFLIINVPAVDRSQFTAAMGASAPATEKAAIAAFNSDVASMMTSFKQSHSDITYFLFDSYTLFTNILNNPETYPATAQLKVLDNYCPDYSNGAASPDPSCSAPVAQYFWLNNLHPTFTVHQAVAIQVAQTLG